MSMMNPFSKYHDYLYEYSRYAFAHNRISQSILPEHRAHYVIHRPSPERNGNSSFTDTTPNIFVVS